MQRIIYDKNYPFYAFNESDENRETQLWLEPILQNEKPLDQDSNLVKAITWAIVERRQDFLKWLTQLAEKNGRVTEIEKIYLNLIELERITLNQSFDEQPMPELSSEEIDFRATSEAFTSVYKLKPQGLESLGLVAQYHSKLVPTIAGIILFGKTRDKMFPDAWIQCGRFRGIDKTNIIDSSAIHSYPILAIEDALVFIEKHAMRSIDIKHIKHQVRWSVPLIAIREALINAVVHADYSQQGAPIRIAIFDDRIEIENPGLLRFGLTTEDIKRGISKLRNRTIGKIFNKLGLIEQWGSGIQRILNSCKEAGFPEPKFEEIGTHFRVTLFTQQVLKPKIDKKDQAILSLLKSDEGLNTQIIAQEIKMSARATRTRLIKLIELGYVVEIANSAQDPHRQYFLAKK